MSSNLTPTARLQHLRHFNQKLTRDQREHVTRRSCQDSNWPFTGDLTPQEIVCMRDTYCGRRRFPSCLQPPSSYDALHNNPPGWNQWATKDARQIGKDAQFSAKKEDKNRKVVVFGNSTYGHYLDRFIDFTYKDNARSYTCERQFSSTGPISTLPPIMDIYEK